MMNNQVMGGMNNQMQQMNPNQVIDHDENLSDKEIYPGSMHQQVSETVRVALLFRGLVLCVNVFYRSLLVAGFLKRLQRVQKVIYIVILHFLNTKIILHASRGLR